MTTKIQEKELSQEEKYQKLKEFIKITVIKRISYSGITQSSGNFWLFTG